MSELRTACMIHIAVAWDEPAAGSTPLAHAALAREMEDCVRERWGRWLARHPRRHGTVKALVTALPAPEPDDDEGEGP